MPRTASFIFTRSAPDSRLPTDYVASVRWATRDGTALAGRDYVAASGTLVFEHGQPSKTVRVSVADPMPADPQRTFRLVLFDPINCRFERNYAVCVIPAYPVVGADDGSVSPGTPIPTPLPQPELSVAKPFSPRLLFDGRDQNAAGTFSGSYRKLTDSLFVELELVLLSRGFGALGEAASISGLPFPSASQFPQYLTVASDGVHAPGGIVAQVDQDAISLFHGPLNRAIGAEPLTYADFTDTSYLLVTGRYVALTPVEPSYGSTGPAVPDPATPPETFGTAALDDVILDATTLD